MAKPISGLFHMIGKKFFTYSVFTLILMTAHSAASADDVQYPVYPTVAPNATASADQLQRGEYLTKLGDCIACHTAPGGKAFAGGLPIDTPFGAIYTPNISPDNETGLGQWSEQDFIRAMREGISPKGQYYYPAFPYLYFNTLTDEDLKDIWDYLRATPAINQANRKNSMMFPFNWRFLQLGWRVMFFDTQKTGPFHPNANQSAEWNRGNYLVNGLGHCAMCHSPSYYLMSEKYSLGAPMRKYDFTGAMVQGYYAPNITSALLEKTSVKEFSKVFLEDRLIGGGAVQGPMKEANQNSLKYLSPDDIKAIHTYLVSVKNPSRPKPTSHSTGSSKGADIYEQYCTGCHTTGAGGAPKLGDAAAWGPRLKQGMDLLYKNAIDGIGGMPPKGTCVSCTDQEIKDAVDYIAKESSSGSGEATTTVAKAIPRLTMADGKHIYDKYCAVCHAPGTNYLNAPVIGDQPTWAPIISQGVDVVIMRTIQGYGHMAPRGGCSTCNDAQVKAAVLYMLQNSQTGKDYSLW
jgi:cytochrome c5